MSIDAEQPSSPLRAPVHSLRGVGPVRARRLEALGIRTVGDLLRHLPSRYESWEAPRPIASVTPGEEVTVRGRVIGSRFHGSARGQSVLRVRVEDEGGAIEALFFGQPYLRDRFPRGAPVVLHGKTLPGPPLRLASPRVEGPSTPFPRPGVLLPVYPATEGLRQASIRSLVSSVLPLSEVVEDMLPPSVLSSLSLPSLSEALRAVHEPSRLEDAERARRRLALEELLDLQTRIARARRRRRARRAPRVVVDDRLDARIRARFPFPLTASQDAAIEEIRRDLASGIPMRRILQGDVGCGKTVVALYAALAAIARGSQAAILAPTTLLAEQHAGAIRRFLAGSSVRVALVEGGRGADEPREAAREGRAHLVVGTHALLGDRLAFRRLGLAVIDEQHRFGVAQRARLLAKGRDAHALALSATPIPRTLALTLYGDLDVTTIPDRPLGRGRTRTRLLDSGGRPAIVEELEARLRGGERAFWVVPRVGESDAGEGALSAFEEFRRRSLGDRAIGLVHGRVPAREREATLGAFRRGEVGLLVATTVVEVGLDVPEATLLVVDGAERLGLAALHQLRGRVGRGPRDAECILLAAPEARPRLEILVETDDGFRIAEEDLRRRGPGEAFGKRQWGSPIFRAADLRRDADLMRIARDLALSVDRERAILRPPGPERASEEPPERRRVPASSGPPQTSCSTRLRST